ncbi:MAG: hypothetical protein LC791_10930, partial [Acidobacteria bacterium]|nr:hypothetical protein [Acidobacteriota bacterium]
MSGFAALLVALLAWSAFSFGGIYPWGYWPLLSGCGAAGVWGWMSPKNDLKFWAPGPLVAGIAAVCLATLMQLVPLPSAVVERLSPAREAVVRSSQLGEMMASPRTADGSREARSRDDAWFRPLSIAPTETVVALVFAIAFGVLFAGASQKLSSRDVQSV